jgi:hypothetical protein
MQRNKSLKGDAVDLADFLEEPLEGFESLATVLRGALGFGLLAFIRSHVSFDA